MNPPNTVLIIGCGIAGPALAILLGRKGYHPIIFDKVSGFTDAGGGIGLAPNGLKVLEFMGLGEEMTKYPELKEAFTFYTSNGELLADATTATAEFGKMFGASGRGLLRQDLNRDLRLLAEAEGAVVKGESRLKSIDFDTERVVARFENDHMEDGMMLIGCDGIKSMTLGLMLQEKGIARTPASYLGLATTYGVTPRPSYLDETNGFRLYYGVNASAVVYAISDVDCFWIIYTPEPQEKGPESWRMWQGEKELSALKTELSDRFAGWQGVQPQLPHLIRNSRRIGRFGSYDRPSLPPDQWYHGRCALVGDAAHPMTTSLAQGANQALEDCYHLANLLPPYPSPESSEAELDQPPTSEQITDAFRRYALLREPRTAALTLEAQKSTRARCLSDPDAIRARNEFFKTFGDPQVALKRLMQISGPSF